MRKNLPVSTVEYQLGDGAVIVSTALSQESIHLLGLDRALSLRDISDGHRAYLPWHRDFVLKRMP